MKITFDSLASRAKILFGEELKKSRTQKLYNLTQFFLQTTSREGLIAECGAWKGLSSYFLCHYARQTRPEYDGSGFHLFDSFEGLPGPDKEEDGALERPVQGKFNASLPEVRQALSEFPKIQYHAGWFSQTFRHLKEAVYKFVHVDADLYQSTYEAIEYFFPRLEPKGILMCDDYTDPKWPGVKKAVDRYCERHSLSVVALSTRQAVFLNAQR